MRKTTSDLTAVVNVRVPVNLKQEALRRAERAGKNLSEWVRDVVQEKTQPEMEHAA